MLNPTKKSKVAAQFLTEIFAVTLAAVIIGIAVGGVTAVPVANALLEGQTAQNEKQLSEIQDGFGRDFGGEFPGGTPSGMGGGGFERPTDFGDFMGQAESYVTEINSAMNFTVVLQMLGIAVGLTLIAGIASMLFVMRYEPLKILANRD